eukprot:CAMPEP_0172311056 /NCGR_PEP_ID=MMETSP1058-20130122/13654_1 /TAXON_ID=83371 /ORGANISM="Detonula confervacea, Strain CCMP 353" /LENGTH=378 /DNA_ID=CAMNT_0013024113 /DNA_START=60 /DNA_END=1196 /DNA_ORIENTATION=+
MFHHALLLAVALAASPRSVEAFAPIGAVSTSLSSRVSSFNAPSTSRPSHHANHHRRSKLFSSRVTFADVERKSEDVTSFDPLDCSNGWDDSSPIHHRIKCASSSSTSPSLNQVAVTAPILAISSLLINPSNCNAVTKISEGYYNPDSFKPICGASDSFYRFLQGSTRAVVGDDNFSEYGPLIAGGLLRIRLELCVVESFFNEAVGPFIKENGLSWILPLHETVETFLAGTIFALATTFILVGSTKLIQIIAFYGDLVVGGPSRLIGGFFFDRARGEPVTLDVSFFGFWKTRLVGPPVDFKEEELKKATKPLLDFENVKPVEIPLLVLSGGVKVVGEASKLFREFIEALDLFVGRYLVLLASGYIILKFVHFKVFPDFP